MKIIDAYWEQRNLGVDAVEFEVAADDKSDIITDIIANEKQYNVVKIPAGNTDVMLSLQNNGYKLIEDMLHFSILPGQLKLNSIQKRLSDAIKLEEMDESDIKYLYSELRKGIFDTDRIYRDPHFTPRQAAERYVGWTKDELARGTILYKMVYKGNAIGFTSGRPGSTFSYLTGMYTDYKKSGLGINVITKNYEISVKYGARVIDSYVSDNNRIVWKMHIEVGSKIVDIIHIFVKHCCPQV